MELSAPKLEIICFHNGTPTVAFFLHADRSTTIGRAIDNVVVLDDERCSRFHATVDYRDGKWRLFDLNSRNGTLVDGVRVEGSAEIYVGSKIQIGSATLLIEAQRDLGSFTDSREMTGKMKSTPDFFTRHNEQTVSLDRERTEELRRRALHDQNSKMIGQSDAIRKVERCINRAARTKTTVLIRGESGVGKELVARAVHELSSRRNGPMVCLNCAAFSESLLTSELFGHEKGAFTGALETKIGKFEAADGGTIFLDEIAEMNPALQATFLRVLEGATFERVGGNQPISVDVRVVAATNRNLEDEVKAGRFRHDLYFRLCVLEINVPPLREREGDVDLLADYFREKFSQETGRRYLEFTPDVVSGDFHHQRRQCQHAYQVGHHHHAVEGIGNIPGQVHVHQHAADEYHRDEDNLINGGGFLTEEVAPAPGSVIAPAENGGKGEQQYGDGHEFSAEGTEYIGKGLCHQRILVHVRVLGNHGTGA